MPSIQKIVLALTFVASALAAQISDGQIQQPTVTPTIAPAVKQITDGQIQQVTVTPTPTIAPPVKQITDGQVQQVSASIKPVATTNGTITTPTPAAFKGAASLMTFDKEMAVVAVGAAAAFALL